MAKPQSGKGARARTETEEQMPLTGLEDAPEIFVDGYQGAMLSEGVAKFNYYSKYFDPISDKMSRKVVARVSMPIAVVLRVHDSLATLVNQLEKAGAIKRTKGGGNGATD